MIRAILVDDEALGLALLRRLLEDTEQVEIVGEYTDPDTALREIPLLSADVVFLDVEMPEKDGISLGTELLEADVELEIVFVTAYERYAVQAFKLNAIHYLLKPVNPDAIADTLSRIVKKKPQAVRPQQAPVSLRLFGDIGFWKKDTPLKVNWITSKVEELFALLVSERGGGISKWRIMDLLWQELDPHKAQQNLYTTVFRLKKALKEADIRASVENETGVYRIVLEGVSSDLAEFEREEERNGSFEEWTAEETEKALGLYQGDLFGERAYPWSLWRRDLCYNRFFGLLKRALSHYAAAGNRGGAKRLLLQKLPLLQEEDAKDVNDFYHKYF
ncbi:response regulator [Gorillibacterium timonense]|uniref:response regulator n=1 Tax=Gorillibacterium timonense TaxID=1689269 RepID=UPI00071D6478|nr:response regulator [Gorillibacterium timonense]